MINNNEIFDSAQWLIKCFGENAELVAEERMQELLEKDDPKAAGIWLSIMSAINDLRSRPPGKPH